MHAVPPPAVARNVRARLVPVVERGARRNWREAYASWASGEPNILKRQRLYKSRRGLPNQTAMVQPPRSRYARRSRRRSRYRRRGVIRRRIPRTLVPKRKLVKMKVVQYHQLYTAGGSIDKSMMQLNSIDDPFGSDGTNQPLGYDQYAALYEFAYVVASKLTVRMHNSGTTSVIVGITPATFNQANTALTSTAHYMELPGTKCRLLSPEVDNAVISNQVNCKKFFGISKLLDTNEYRINLTDETPPSKLAWWHFWADAQDGTSSATLQCTFTLEYVVLLTDYKFPARSVET